MLVRMTSDASVAYSDAEAAVVTPTFAAAIHGSAAATTVLRTPNHLIPLSVDTFRTNYTGALWVSGALYATFTRTRSATR